RRSCLDPLPTCEKICEKIKCENGHFCTKKCHDSQCPKCRKKVVKTCDCGYKQFSLPCFKFKGKMIKCKSICKTLLNCGRHFCETQCCAHRRNGANHICDKICQKLLSCSIHRCEEQCHSAECPSCRVQYQNGLICKCGNTKIGGFFFCGDKKLICNNRCSETLLCGHKCLKKCHFGECPPCSQLIEIDCYGKHKKIKVKCKILLKQKSVSCGNFCDKTKHCGIHSCKRKCHEKDGKIFCSKDDESMSCGDICLLRMNCGHFCKRKCHPKVDCENFKCEEMVTIKCVCGRIEKSGKCENTAERKNLNCDGKCEAKKRAEDFRKAFGIKKAGLVRNKDIFENNFWKNCDLSQFF
ncbi:hypothetical protein MHBO_003282, partial [Bonamia ostreae]